MVNNRAFIPVAPATVDCFLQARIYLATKATPSSVKIHARSLTTNPQHGRFPSVESVLAYSRLQPYIHDVLITVRHGSTQSHFRAFLKRHKRLPTNTALGIQGDLLIMRVASKNLQSVVNMRSADSKLANFVVKKIITRVKAFQSASRKRLSKEFKLVRARR